VGGKVLRRRGSMGTKVREQKKQHIRGKILTRKREVPQTLHYTSSSRDWGTAMRSGISVARRTQQNNGHF